MSGKPRFGQGSPVRAYIEPGFVQKGNPFLLKAIRFDPKANIKIFITAPGSRAFSPVLSPYFLADESGNVNIPIDTDLEWQPGPYTVVVTGTSNGQEVAAEAFVEIRTPTS